MPSQGDFHTHSTISDGRLTPAQLVDLAHRNGVRIMSLTDHDIVDGLPEAFEAAAKYPDFTLVPGIEMSTDIEGGEIHILGHFIDWKNQPFRDRLSRLQESRLGRARGMVAKLAELGKPVAWERGEAFADEGSAGLRRYWRGRYGHRNLGAGLVGWSKHQDRSGYGELCGRDRGGYGRHRDGLAETVVRGVWR